MQPTTMWPAGQPALRAAPVTSVCDMALLPTPSAPVLAQLPPRFVMVPPPLMPRPAAVPMTAAGGMPMVATVMQHPSSGVRFAAIPVGHTLPHSALASVAAPAAPHLQAAAQTHVAAVPRSLAAHHIASGAPPSAAAGSAALPLFPAPLSGYVAVPQPPHPKQQPVTQAAKPPGLAFSSSVATDAAPVAAVTTATALPLLPSPKTGPSPSTGDAVSPAAAHSQPPLTAGSVSRNLFVAGLRDCVRDADLLAAFEPFGTVKSAKVMLDVRNGRSRGFGFVLFADKSEAAAAKAALSGKPMALRSGAGDGGALIVSHSTHEAAHLTLDVPTIHIRNVPYGVTVAAFRSFLENLLAEDADASDMRPSPGRSPAALAAGCPERADQAAWAPVNLPDASPDDTTSTASLHSANIVPDAAAQASRPPVSASAVARAAGASCIVSVRVRSPSKRSLLAELECRTFIVEFTGPTLARRAVALLHGQRPLPDLQADPSLPPLMAKLEEPREARMQRLEHRARQDSPAPEFGSVCAPPVCAPPPAFAGQPVSALATAPQGAISMAQPVMRAVAPPRIPLLPISILFGQPVAAESAPVGISLPAHLQ